MALEPLIVKGMDEAFTIRSNKLKLMEECRICLKMVADIPIFGSVRSDLSVNIMNFGGITVGKDDGLPQYLCVPCYKLLESAVLFQETAKQSDIVLKLKKNKNQIINTNIASTNSIDFIKVEVPLIEPTRPIVKKEMEIKTQIEDSKKTIDFKYKLEIDEVYVDSFHGESLETKAETDLNVQFNSLVCKKSYKTIQEFERHVASKGQKLRKEKNKNRKKDEIHCAICNLTFTRYKYMKHMNQVHNSIFEKMNKQRKECKICKKNLHPNYMAFHMKVKHGVVERVEKLKPKAKIQCPICNQLYTRRYYRQHCKLHNSKEKMEHMCDRCGKKFTFLYALKIHRLTHSNVLPYKCGYCPYRGRSKELLKVHERTHTGDYPYKCTECNVRYTTKSNLNMHMKRHRGPIDFICDSCSRGFYTKLELERHISVKHLGIRNHICKICGMAFGYKRCMVAHTRKVHKVAKGLGKAKASYLKYDEEDQLKNVNLQNENFTSKE